MLTPNPRENEGVGLEREDTKRQSTNQSTRRVNTEKDWLRNAHQQLKNNVVQMKEMARDNKNYTVFQATLAKTTNGLSTMLYNFPHTILPIRELGETIQHDTPMG